MRTIKYGIALLVLLATLAFLPRRAEADRFAIVLNSGDAVAHLAPVPAARQAEVKEATGQDVAIGYSYAYFGMFWLDLWTWDGKYCLYHDKTYWELKPAEAAELLGVAENKLPKPFFYSYPPLLGLLLALGLLFTYLKIFVKSDEQKAELLQKDERYGQALAIFRKLYDEAMAGLQAELKPHVPADGTTPLDKSIAEAAQATMRQRLHQGVDAGVGHLIGLGIERDTASKNFSLLIKVKFSQQFKNSLNDSVVYT